MPGTIRARGGAREMSIHAVVTRCGCGDPSAHPESPCPRPRARENHGRISYFHKRFWRRWLWQVERFARSIPRAFSMRGN
jgi:hypothetical protein